MDNEFITNVFVTIAFFLPGFVAKWISNYISGANENQSSELEKSIVSLSWNVTPIFISWVFFSIHGDADWRITRFWIVRFVSVQALIGKIEEMPWMLYYFLFSLICSFLVGRYMIERIPKSIFNRVLANIRSKNDLPVIEEGLAWERFLGSEKSTLIKTYPIGHEELAIAGTVRSAYRPGDVHKGITLERTGQVKNFLPYLHEPVRTFVDFESQLVFELYLETEISAALEEWDSNNQSVTQDEKMDESTGAENETPED